MLKNIIVFSVIGSAIFFAKDAKILIKEKFIYVLGNAFVIITNCK